MHSSPCYRCITSVFRTVSQSPLLLFCVCSVHVSRSRSATSASDSWPLDKRWRGLGLWVIYGRRRPLSSGVALPLGLSCFLARPPHSRSAPCTLFSAKSPAGAVSAVSRHCSSLHVPGQASLTSTVFASVGPHSGFVTGSLALSRSPQSRRSPKKAHLSSRA